MGFHLDILVLSHEAGFLVPSETKGNRNFEPQHELFENPDFQLNKRCSKLKINFFLVSGSVWVRNFSCQTRKIGRPREPCCSAQQFDQSSHQPNR